MMPPVRSASSSDYVLSVVAALKFVPLISDVVLFWLAGFRPHAASWSDSRRLFQQADQQGRFEFETYGASAVLLVVLVSGVVWMMVMERRSRRACS